MFSLIWNRGVGNIRKNLNFYNVIRLEDIWMEYRDICVILIYGYIKDLGESYWEFICF